MILSTICQPVLGVARVELIYLIISDRRRLMFAYRVTLPYMLLIKCHFQLDLLVIAQYLLSAILHFQNLDLRVSIDFAMLNVQSPRIDLSN